MGGGVISVSISSPLPWMKSVRTMVVMLNGNNIRLIKEEHTDHKCSR